MHSPIVLEKDLRRQLLLRREGGKRRVSEVLSQALQLEAVDIAAGTPTKLQHASTRTFWAGRDLPHNSRQPTTSLLDMLGATPL